MSIAASFGAIEVLGAPSVSIWAMWATHSLQIHTAARAEVLGSLTRRFASKVLPQNWQRIDGKGSSGIGGFSSSAWRYAASSLTA